MDEGATVPEGSGEGRPLRELLRQGLRARWRPRDLDPPHRPQAPRGRAQRLDLVRPLRPRRGGAAGDQGDRARRGAVGARRLLDPGRRRRDRAGPGRGLGRYRRGQRRLVPDLLRRRRALQVPAGRLALRGAAAADQVRRPLPERALRRPARDRRRDDRARRLAGDDRPQLGQRARRALGLARGHRLRRLPRHLLRRRRRPDQARLADHPLAPLRDADARRRGPPPRRLRPRSAPPRSQESSDACSFILPGRTSSSAAASPPRRRTSSAGSTPTPRDRSTTRSTARSPISS